MFQADTTLAFAQGSCDSVTQAHPLSLPASRHIPLAKEAKCHSSIRTIMPGKLDREDW